MVESAAGLVDQVLPHVPIRQWVLSFPWPLRLLFVARWSRKSMTTRNSYGSTSTPMARMRSRSSRVPPSATGLP